MNKLQFSIDIKAEKNKIWKALWDDASYRDWTSIFSEGSHAVTNNWEEKSIVQFLGKDKSGIYSMIETHIPNKTITFKHIGTVLHGKQQPIDETTKTWSGASETYSLTIGKDCIILTLDIDIMDEHLEFMKETLPKALERVKNNC